MTKKKRSVFNTNIFERRILKTIFLFATLPVFLVILLFFALFSDLIYAYIGSDRAALFINRFIMFAGLLFLYYVIFANMVFQFTNRIAGAYQRLLNELDKIISGTSKNRLHLRKGDYATELINRINQLINKIS